jgi:hypothetical protein
MKYLISIFCALLAITGLIEPAFGYRQVKSFVLRPPEQALTKVKRIAVLDFEGVGGREAADGVVTALLDDKRGIKDLAAGIFTAGKEGVTHQAWATTKVFEVVERSQLEKVMSEQKLGQSGIINDAQASELGRVLGVDAIVSGSVAHDPKETRSREERTIYRDAKKGGNYNVTVDCLERRVVTTVRMRIFSVETAQILGNKEVSRQEKEKHCAEDIGKVPSTEGLLGRGLASAAGELANYFMPYFELAELELAKIKVKEHADKADEAAKLAERGDIDEAYTLYYAIFQQDNYNPDALYNLGILSEIVGNYAEALEMYKNAASLKSTEKDYVKAVDRTEKSVQFAAVLNSLGIQTPAHTWSTSESALAAATAEKITVSGGSSVRVDVYEQPDITSTVVAKVPGGIELTVIESKDGWLKVKLMGGKEGFLPSSKAK